MAVEGGLKQAGRTSSSLENQQKHFDFFYYNFISKPENENIRKM